MKKHILFPTDFSDLSRKAFEYVLEIAGKMQAKITVLHVVVPEVEAMDVPIMAAEATKKRIELAEEIMDTFIGENEIQVTKAFEIGLPGRVICHEAMEKNVDFICMGAQGEHNTIERIIGTVSSFVVANAQCPILIIPENARFKEISTILYATDYQETDPYHITSLVDLLKPYSEIIRCVHVKKSYKTEHKPLNMETLRSFFKSYSPSIQISFHEWESESIYEGLNEFSDIYEVNMVVMLTQRRSLLDRVFHRSETKNFTQHTHLPVMILKEH